jgi:hypothetical protein
MPSTSSSLFARSVSSHFWLFGYLKGVLQVNSFDEHDEFLFAIQAKLMRLDRVALDAVFQEWMIRLQKCVHGNGEYIK